jgi:xylan 1,4-beta-xylosidase
MNCKIPINVSEGTGPIQGPFGTLGQYTFWEPAFCPDLPETKLRIPSVRGPKWALLTGVLAVLIAASASSQQTRVIHADMAEVTGPHSEVPLRVVGAGRAEEGLRADWQEQLAVVQNEIGFKYLRMHGLLCDEMGVYTEDKQGNPQFNFQYVDALYDALLKQHIRPFVELSFMPGKLASGTKTVFWWKGNVTPPKDPAKWAMLIRALLAHWKERYGEAEITQWYYEVWNEPDLKMFWSGSMNDYFSLYKATSEAVKAECPKCRIGGPAAAAQSTAEAFEKWVAAIHGPVDFVSEHTYAIKIGFVDPDGTEGTILDPAPDAVSGRMQHARELVKDSALPNLEIHITEWSSSYSPTDYMHDQYHQASFILDKVRRGTPYVDSMSYWTFTDIFEEHGPQFTPFHGGFGLINLEGIKKPSFYAFKFLSQLGKDDVQTDDARSWVTKSPNGSMQVLVWDYSPVVPPAGQTGQTFYKLEQPATDLGSVEVDLTHVPSGRYHVTLYQTGYKRNDAYTAYLEIHAPNQLTQAQVEALKKTSDGSPISETDVAVTDGHLMHQMTLCTNDVFFLKITPLN